MEDNTLSSELQSIENRRALRKRYRDLKEDLQEHSDLLGLVYSVVRFLLCEAALHSKCEFHCVVRDIKTDTFEEKHTNINELFAFVDNVRELGIDADTLKNLSEGLKKQANSLSDMSSNFNFRSFAESIKASFSNEEDEGFVSWSKLGRDCGGLFSMAPSFR
jgi:hypothetical protein